MRTILQHSCVEGVNFTCRLPFSADFLPGLFDVELEAAFSTAEICDCLLKVLFFAEFFHEDVEGILRPLLDLLPVAVVVVLEVSSHFFE